MVNQIHLCYVKVEKLLAVFYVYLEVHVLSFIYLFDFLQLAKDYIQVQTEMAVILQKK